MPDFVRGDILAKLQATAGLADVGVGPGQAASGPGGQQVCFPTSFWIHLEDVEQDQAPLRLIPKRHGRDMTKCVTLGCKAGTLCVFTNFSWHSASASSGRSAVYQGLQLWSGRSSTGSSSRKSLDRRYQVCGVPAESPRHMCRISSLAASSSSSVPIASTLPSFSSTMRSARCSAARRCDTTRQV